MSKGKIFVIAAGGVLIALTVVLGLVEQIVQAGIFVPAAAGVVLIGISLIWGWAARHRGMRTALVLLCLTGVLTYSAAEVCVFSGLRPPETGAHRYAVVLGGGLYGDVPSETLCARLDVARDYAAQYPDCLLILSGCQGWDETISEAEAMRRYLVQAGVAEERLILEDTSRNTVENMRNSAAILARMEGGSAPYDCVIISSDFHLFRARRLARRAGLNDAAIAAPTPVRAVGIFLREGLSVILFWLRCLFGLA